MLKANELSPTRKIILLALLSAFGTLLMYLELPVTLYNFLRIDLSDIVVMVAFVMFGVREGILVAFIKAFIHFILPMTNYTAGVGEIAAFIASSMYVIGYYFASNKLNLGVIFSLVVSVVTMTLVMTFLNWLIIMPLYGIVLVGSTFPNITEPTYIWSVLSVYIPFNLLKGVIVMTVFYGTARAIQLELK